MLETSSHALLSTYENLRSPCTGPTDEFDGLPQTPAEIRNVGWTLGNDCPYRCNHCYSLSARQRGKDMQVEIVDRVVKELSSIHVDTVNLGGNEPLFTNGIDPRNSLLPYIIRRICEANMKVGLTTSGISLLYLHRNHRWAFELLNDVDISLDSPLEEEHNANRGAALYEQAIKALETCERHNKPHTCVMTAMNWNFSLDRIEGMMKIARTYGANIRINPMKPVEARHMDLMPTAAQYYSGFAHLAELCSSLDLGEPPLAALANYKHARRCPCGRTSFRIHSINPDGALYISPCVYLHDYKSPFDLLKFSLSNIIESAPFTAFRQRHANPQLIEGCDGCGFLWKCGGGCIARSYLHEMHQSGRRTLLARDPYCPRSDITQLRFPEIREIDATETLVHVDYLCTWIGRPR